jgi:energy-coupling factor transporter ATP-binding protein EcfA2
MGRRELIAGPNFSGRSAAMLALLRGAKFARECFYVGPYAEAALSGLSSTIADEIEIYRAKPASVGRAIFAPSDFELLGRREPQTLSGGEQVLLALHCFSRSAFTAIAVDTALEQLDGTNRASALAYLERGDDCQFNAALIDNRIEPPLANWSCHEQTAAPSDYVCDFAALADALVERHASTVTVRDLHFGYRQGQTIFAGADLTLEPGRAYRLFGPNGAGKTTLLKILVGVLRPLSGQILLDGKTYAPWRTGNRAIALATQNPDHQWCGSTLRSDIARRRSAMAHIPEKWTPVFRNGYAPTHESRPQMLASDERLSLLGRYLGFSSLDLHLYELPLAARKRLSWLWPFSGALPWIMLDEPTIGQDSETRRQLAAIVGKLCALGHGIILVTHDDDFAARVPHQVLAIEDRKIRSCRQ